MIRVTKTFLPPQAEYQEILEDVWRTGWVTNRGVLVKELEDKIKIYLNTDYILATANGTLPLQLAIKAMGLNGEIITTPFSYVATTSSIVWEGCTPVFVDIHPDYLTIDETKIEAAITRKTSAILATHVFGNPCHVEVIDSIANKYDLKVIYDGAHAFGVRYKGQSIFNYGDISTCSFHATKLFHTGEGGALFCNSERLYNKLYYHHNFGHQGQETFQGLGINAKMSELQAAMGLAILPYIDDIMKARNVTVDLYDKAFKSTSIQRLLLREETEWNYGYYPIILRTEKMLLNVKQALESQNIYPRRYFYPSLNKLPYLEQSSFKVSESVASRILCLPLSHNLRKEEIELITTNIIKVAT
ncbi:DegT/DnrJ/EryC1/StrS family aminotransferase [Aestuariivivens sediminicola]|uniref:DegT/DnrJ/EryC1/StrS family aminotransferase n=1 Tax=Aestuariivivens sediminicola TaxID=2913560 RepID=UPI001F56C415|nr:DegT/DnrJ/EryC1/StrS family aminotransferase [Aestuariivivens sediminicola]